MLARIFHAVAEINVEWHRMPLGGTQSCQVGR